VSEANINNVRGQIEAARTEETRSPGEVDYVEARGIVRASLAAGFSVADIRTAVNQSNLTQPERDLLLHQLITPPSVGHLVPAANGISTNSVSSRTPPEPDGKVRELGALQTTATVDAGRPGHAGSMTISVGASRGEQTREMREQIFDHALATAYGLNPDVIDTPGPAHDAFQRLLHNRQISGARTAFTAREVNAGQSFTVPLPRL
jgi:hypothetical protein